MSETVSVDHQNEMQSTTPHLVEIYDIYLTDGTHLRYCSDNQDGSYLDYVVS